MDYVDVELSEEDKEEIKKTIGMNLQRLRKQVGMTQEELGGRIMSNGDHISKIECGKVEPKIIMIYHICVALGISVNDLFRGQRLSNRLPMGFSENYARLDEKQAEMLNKMLELMVRQNEDEERK